jgi:hypothetical protein
VVPRLQVNRDLQRFPFFWPLDIGNVQHHKLQHHIQIMFPSRAAFPIDGEFSVQLKARSADKWVENQWENNNTIRDLIQKAKEGKFIEGIKNNTLEPQAFGIYMLQDISYLASALVKFLKTLSNFF